MRSMMLAAASVILLAAVVQPAYAQEGRSLPGDSTIVVLPEITVIATRIPVLLDEAPGYIRVGRLTASANSAADVIRQTGAAHVRRLGPQGLASLSLRGGSASQTAIVLDGFSLTNAQLGQIDLSSLPAAFLSRVELLGGGASASYGSDAITGVVRMEGVDARTVGQSLTLGYGAFGERSGVVSTAVRLGRLAVGGVARVASTDGDFPFTDRASFPSTSARRQNGDRRDSGLQLHTHYASHNVSAQGRLLISSTRRGVPGIAGAQSQDERQRDDLIRLTGTVESTLGQIGVTFAGLVEESRLRYTNGLLQIDDLGTVGRVGMKGQATIPLRRSVSNRALAFAEYQRFVASHPSLQDDATRDNVSIGAASTYGFRGATLHPSIRLDAFDVRGADPRFVASPRLAATRRLGSKPVVLKAALGRAFRMPTFNDLYWRSAGASGNPDLLPEASWSAEMGAGWHQTGQTADLAVFARETRNEISWEPDSRNTWRPINVGRARSVGVQASTSRAIPFRGGGLNVDVGYSLTRARDVSTGAPRVFRYNPTHTASSILGVRVGSASADISVQGTSRRFITVDSRESVPGHVLVDLSVAYQFGSRVADTTIGLLIENVGDVEYEIVSGYPMPPRHMRIQISTKLN